MAYKRKSKIKLTASQEKAVARVAAKRERELMLRFAQYASDAIRDKMRVSLTLVLWDGRIDSIVRKSIRGTK